MNFLKRIVVFCIIFIVLFTGVSMYTNFRGGIELSPTLTTCVFAFFGTELVSTAFIRILQDKEEKDRQEKEKSQNQKIELENKIE